jgi:hypothetical protein
VPSPFESSIVKCVASMTVTVHTPLAASLPRTPSTCTMSPVLRPCAEAVVILTGNSFVAPLIGFVAPPAVSIFEIGDRLDTLPVSSTSR